MSEDEQTPTISLRENGPYLVRNVTRITNSKGSDLQSSETMALCRCGNSANKPFCDGTHRTTGFSGENLADSSRDRFFAKGCSYAAQSPAANISGSDVRHSPSTTMPLSQVNPVASASSVLGTIPIPTTTSSAE